MTRTLALLCLLLVVPAAFPAEDEDTPPFQSPRASAREPAGAAAGVIEVTNVYDRGPGSLRTAIEARGPRIVVFRTGGTIELESELVLTA